MIFYFLYYFSSFHFIFIHSRFISFFLFSFFFFLLFSSPQVSNPSSFIFFFISRTFQQLICFTSKRERERERGQAGGDRGCRKDKSVEIGIHHAALPHPPPHCHLSSSPPPGSDQRSFFFFFSYLLVLIQIYFKNWILFCVLCLDYVRNGVRMASSSSSSIFCFFFFSYLLVLIQIYFKN